EDPAIASSRSSSAASPSSAQKRLVSGNDILSCDEESGSEPARATRSSRSPAGSAPVPRSVPYRSTDGARSMSPVAVTFRLAASSFGPLGAHSCHASMTEAAAAYGHGRAEVGTPGQR